MIISDIVDFLFGISLFVNAALFIPQIMKLLKLKDSREFSRITFVGFCLAQFLYICYGILHHDTLLILGNMLSLLTCGTVTVLIYRYRHKAN